MACARRTQFVRRGLFAFARGLARPFSDSRRRAFVEDMVQGLAIANHVHLSRVARAVSSGREDIHGIEKRLSLYLGSDHWDMSPVADRLLADGAALVNDDSLIAADLTDLARYRATKLQGLGTVHDGSDPAAAWRRATASSRSTSAPAAGSCSGCVWNC